MRNRLFTFERRELTDQEKVEADLPVRDRWRVLDIGLGPFGFEFAWKVKA